MAGAPCAGTLAELGDLADSQYGVVDVAVERLYIDARERQEAEAWERAALDESFVAEMQTLERAYADRDTWPR